jgi:hypothetical protein
MGLGGRDRKASLLSITSKIWTVAQPVDYGGKEERRKAKTVIIHTIHDGSTRACLHWAFLNALTLESVE